MSRIGIYVLEIPVHHVSGMHVLQCCQQLVSEVLDMLIA
jgi:hypothetical protein